MSLTLAARCRVLCLISAAALFAAPGRANEPAHGTAAEAAKPAAPAEKPAPAAEPARAGEPAHAPEPAAARAPAAAPSGDSLVRVRELLAEKLGARQTSQVAGPNDMRIPARGGDGAADARRSRSVALAARRTPAAEETVASPAHPVHWSYDGEAGPAAWAQLKPEYAQCAIGKRQSPIDIRDGIVVQLDAVKFDYRPSGFSVVDNGHTVQVNVAPGNSIEVLGRRYDLVQFHFHRPSEERINGRQFDMVVHLVHKDADGRLAVVAVLLERGAAQSVVQSVWNNLPLEQNEPVAAPSAIDLNQLLPDDRRYYTYMGSLTTPPCSEGVLWMVMKKPVPIAAEQINVFAKLYPMNARPLQAASGRLIKESQ